MKKNKDFLIENPWGPYIYRSILADKALAETQLAYNANNNPEEFKEHLKNAKNLYKKINEDKSINTHPSILTHQSALHRFFYLDNSTALKLIKKAYDLSPKNIEVLNLFARIKADNCDYNDAFEYLDIATKLQPHSPILMGNHASLLIRNGQPEAAIELLTRAIDAAPGSMELVFNKGIANLTLGKINLAENDFKIAIKMCNDTQKIFLNYFLALILEIKGQYEDAINLLEIQKKACNDKALIYIDEFFLSKDNFISKLDRKIIEIKSIKNREKQFNSHFKSYFFSFNRCEQIKKYQADIGESETPISFTFKN